MALLALFVIWRILIRPAKSPKEQSNFVAVLKSALSQQMQR